MNWDRLLENESLETKRELPSSQKLAIEVIAFANTKGGRIIIGYDDKSQTFVGITPNQQTEEKIANIIHDCCTPQIPFSVSYETVEGQPLLIIDIPVSWAKPHYLKSKGMAQGTYVRVGSTCRCADQEMLARLIREGKHISFDSETVSRAISVNPQRMEQYLVERQKRLGAKIVRVTPVLLENLHVHEQGHPTVAGCLLFCDAPQEVPELSHAFIKAARFKGTAKGVFLDQAEMDGCLPDQIDKAVSFVLRNIHLSGSIKGSKRIERYDYPPDIIREAIVNAVIHRDYSLAGACILLAVYDDRLEITSPGGLPGRVTVETITDRQYNRNPIIAKRMFEMAYFDSWGQGIDRILEWAEACSSKKPEFSDAYDQFTLTLYPENSISATPSAFEPPLSKLQIKILEYVDHHGRVTNRELQETLGLTKAQAQWILKKLKDTKVLRIHGAGRSTFYSR